MSLHLLASGVLVTDPVRRQGSKATFTTAILRVLADDAPILISAIAFGDTAERLLGYRKGDIGAVSGRGRLSAWTSSAGDERHGLSLVVDQLASLKPQRRASRPSESEPAPRYRRPYPRPRPDPSPGDGAALDDGVDDLWPERRP